MKKAIVWLKKDLRTTDHRPLYEAASLYDQVIALYIYEPNWFSSYEYDTSHLNFINQSLQEIESELASKNIQLVIRYGDAEKVFKNIKNEFEYKHVFAHQETGVDWTYQRDLKLISFFKDNGIHFKEYYQMAVIRRLNDRKKWPLLREQIIDRKIIPEIRNLSNTTSLESIGTQDHTFFNKDFCFKSDLQVGGSSHANKALDSFLSLRSENYLKHISSPMTARLSGSRLSPYLTYGNISLAKVQSELKKAQDRYKYNPNWKKSLSAFESRLWWHCHFIQKLETEPDIEFYNMNRAYDGLRESEFNEIYFEAWKKGETGYPMIDASMRCLLKTSWINFRMRAMLVSFASYHLWLHWRKPAEFLAKHFLDFEPGIHFSQFQMQSGVTGVNMIRIYSPLKQASDQIRAGDFIRLYCPELENIPDEYIHDPQTMPPLLQIEAGLKLGENYPYPIVDHKIAYNSAKKRIFEYAESAEVQNMKKEVLKKHVSR